MGLPVGGVGANILSFLLLDQILSSLIILFIQSRLSQPLPQLLICSGEVRCILCSPDNIREGFKKYSIRGP